MSRPAIFAAALAAGLVMGVLPPLVLTIGLALWCHAEDTYKKKPPALVAQASPRS